MYLKHKITLMSTKAVTVEITDNENAVGTVSEGWWPLGLLISTILVLVASSKTASKYMDEVMNDYVILGALFIMSVLVSVPYIHYQIKGGKFTRLPPRYNFSEKYHDKMTRVNQKVEV